MGAQPETAACVRDAEKKKTRCASCSPQVQEPRAGAQPETAACVRDAEKKKTRCASCSPQVQEPRAGAQPETAACVRDAGKKKTRCASCSPQVCPPQARGCAGLFPLIFRLFLFGFLPLKLLFICRSGRDGNFLACPLPWLCFRPAGLVTCCFFADFCAHCLFACRALCFGCLFICLCCLRGFSLLFFTLSCLTSSSQTSFHLSLRPRRASTFFRKESRQRFARGAAPFEPPFLCPAADLPFPRAAGRLNGPSGRKPPADGETLEKPRSRAQLFKRFCAWGTRRSFFPARENRSRAQARSRKQPRACETRRRKRHGARLAHRRCRSRAWARSRKEPRACAAGRRQKHGARLAHRRCARRRRGGVQGFFLLSFAFSCLAFCLSKFFSLVAQAATGISSLVPSRGFVPGPRVLSPAAFSRTFAPIACLPVLRCSRGFSPLFFTFSCLTSSSQTSFHLSLRPRRASTFFRKESRQRFARGAAPSNPHSCALRPISPFLALLAGLAAIRPQTAGR